MLTPREIASMRRTAEQALPDTAIRLTETRASDGRGGHTTTWTPGGTIPCRVAPVGGGETSSRPGARVDERSTHVITLPARTQVSERDRLEVADTTYAIVLVRKREAWELTRRLEVIEVQ